MPRFILKIPADASMPEGSARRNNSAKSGPSDLWRPDKAHPRSDETVRGWVAAPQFINAPAGAPVCTTFWYWLQAKKEAQRPNTSTSLAIVNIVRFSRSQM